MDYTGPQAEIMPRRVLQNQISKARDLGFDVQAAYEFEFIVRQRPPSHYGRRTSRTSRPMRPTTAAGPDKQPQHMQA